MNYDFKKWNELSNLEQQLAIEMFKLHEKENFNDEYTDEQAVEVLSEREDFIVDDSGDELVVY